MAQIAICLSQRGYKVSGSDKEFYEPMGGLLKSSAVELKQGYSENNLAPHMALVVIGNAVTKDNPEVVALSRLQLRYTCFPQLLYDLAIAGRHSIVVAGTHGKTSTTALTAHLLEQTNYTPSFFVGGVPLNFGTGLKIGATNFSVVEGDEYDSVFFAKVPKFTFYRPDTCVLTSIEFDHADIYPNLDAIKVEFTKLVLGMKKNGLLVCCADCPNIRSLLPEWRSKASCQIVTYGKDSDADYCLISTQPNGRMQSLSIAHSKLGKVAFSLSMIGEHNGLNATGVFAALSERGVEQAKLLPRFATFLGTKRRQELRIDSSKLTLIDDFAHHPTAVRETIRAVKAAFRSSELIAVFEPRSNTSRRKVFQDEYVSAFGSATQVILSDVPQRESDKGLDLLDVPSLASEIQKSGVPTRCLKDPDTILKYLESEIESRSASHRVILVMSNGGFGGLVDRLEHVLRIHIKN